MKRGILILLILFCFAAPPFVREAQAMDPVTIAILTPIAIKGAQVAAPYVMRGLASGARHMVSMGYDLINFFRLPLGFLQVTAGIPFGQLKGGLNNIVAGFTAPVKFTIKTLILPVAFCNIGGGIIHAPDPEEPARVGKAAAALGLRHAVVTSVTRDDLPDGGSAHFAATIRAIRDSGETCPTIEVLIPDFRGNREALQTVMAAEPHIINHNVETPPAHYSRIRPQADYQQSLELLRRVKEAGRVSKSGLMVGLGETDEEVHGVLADLAAAGCDIVTIGQYMRPSQKHHPVERYVHPDIFESYAQKGREMGIPFVFSAPLVRSSYNAEQAYASLLNRQQHMPSETSEPRGSEQP